MIGSERVCIPDAPNPGITRTPCTGWACRPVPKPRQHVISGRTALPSSSMGAACSSPSTMKTTTGAADGVRLLRHPAGRLAHHPLDERLRSARLHHLLGLCIRPNLPAAGKTTCLGMTRGSLVLIVCGNLKREIFSIITPVALRHVSYITGNQKIAPRGPFILFSTHAQIFSNGRFTPQIVSATNQR